MVRINALNYIRGDTASFEASSAPGKPAENRNSHRISVADWKVLSTENVTCGFLADNGPETILLRKTGEHLGRAVQSIRLRERQFCRGTAEAPDLG